MAEELQSLLDKINEEGVRKAEAQRSEIIAAAEAEAKAIRAKAAEDAEAVVKAAKEEAAGLQARAESAIRQAARDILLELQSELQRRITRAVSSAAEQALTPELMAGLIRDLAAKFAASPDAQLTVLSAAKDVPALEAALRSALADSFRSRPKLFASPEIKGGMEVSFKNGEVYFDFTSDAITELVAEYIGPRLAKLLADGK